MDLEPSVPIGNEIAHRERTNLELQLEGKPVRQSYCSIASCRAIVCNQVVSSPGCKPPVALRFQEKTNLGHGLIWALKITQLAETF